MCLRKLGSRIHFGEVINLSQFDQTKGLGIASIRNLLRVERSIPVKETGLQKEESGCLMRNVIDQLSGSF